MACTYILYKGYLEKKNYIGACQAKLEDISTQFLENTNDDLPRSK
jgi:hypothetical protein